MTVSLSVLKSHLSERNDDNERYLNPNDFPARCNRNNYEQSVEITERICIGTALEEHWIAHSNLSINTHDKK